MWIDKEKNAAFNFIPAPDFQPDSINEVMFPIGKVRTATPENTVLTLRADAHYNYYDEIDIPQNVTLKAIIPYNLPIGAELLVPLTADGGDRTISFGEGFTGGISQGQITISDGETKVLFFKWNGTQFLKIN